MKGSFEISASDLSYLWEDCRRCFYRKIVEGSGRPKTPFPGVFSTIDRAMKEFYVGRRAELAIANLAPGELGGADRWVKSEPLLLDGCETPCILKGRVDILSYYDDGSIGVLDFKVSHARQDDLARFTRQLHAYALALERPASGKPLAVSSIGLVCYLPTAFEGRMDKGLLTGDLNHVELPREDTSFLRLLGEVVSVLEMPVPPPPSEKCWWCLAQGEISAKGASQAPLSRTGSHIVPPVLATRVPGEDIDIDLGGQLWRLRLVRQDPPLCVLSHKLDGSRSRRVS